MAYNPPRKNIEYIFYIGLISQSTGQLQANPTIAAGDFKVSTDGGAFGNLGTLPAVTPAGGKAVKVTLANTEMNGDNVVVIGSDASGAEWNDIIVSIQPSIAYSTDGVIDADLKAITAGVDLSATMKTSVTTAATAATPTVTISSGSGAGQLDITSGVVKANLAQILGTALTETAGQIAAAFKKFFDKAAPTGTINSLPDAVAGAAGGVAIVGSVMGKSPATLAAADVSGNLPADLKAITAGVDLSATMKTSVTTAATAATPTVTISSGTGAGQLSITSGVVKSNMTQIDGQATNGTNATLNLKKLNVVNDNGTAVFFQAGGVVGNWEGLHCIGANGGRGIRATGGTTGDGFECEGGFSSGSGLYIASSAPSYGMNIDNGANISGTLSMYKLEVSNNAGDAVLLESTGGNGHGINVSGNGTGKSINAPNDIAVSDGDLTIANLQLISAGQITVKKNVALPNFAFVMTDTDGVPLTGLSPAAERRIDSGSFAACANTPATELANGWYTIDLADSDLNGTIIALRFSDTGAADTNFTIVTQD